jgi:hypothetical protein
MSVALHCRERLNGYHTNNDAVNSLIAATQNRARASLVLTQDVHK